MLTPQEVSERAFQKASFGGYNMSQVDEFLDILTGDYSALYSENAVLKSKMKVLVDKVEEYRSTEEAMRKALMTAQRMADDLVREAEEKKNAMLEQAQAEVNARMANVSQELAAEEFRLQQAQNATAVFVEKVRALYASQEEYLDSLQELCPPAANNDDGTSVDDTASEIDDNVQRLLEQAMKDVAAKNLRNEAAEMPDPDDTAEFAPVSGESEELERSEAADAPRQSSRIDFGDLQFGRDYQIK